MSPFAFLFFALLSIPLIEIYLLITVGKVIGAGATVLLVVITAILGAWLLRWQGLNTFNRLQATMARGELPAQELLEGFILLITGAFLLTPGFFTDAIGFALLIPALRAWCAQRIVQAGIHQVRTGAPRRPGGGHVIDGDYYETDPVNGSPERLPQDASAADEPSNKSS